MKKQQYEECLIQVLTYFESLNEAIIIQYCEENPFGIPHNEFLTMIHDLRRNNYINANLSDSAAMFIGITMEGRDKLEELRENSRNRIWYRRTLHWICDIWWIHCPILLATIHYLFELIKSLLQFFNSSTL